MIKIRLTLVTLPFLVLACQDKGIIHQSTPSPESYLKPYVCSTDQDAEDGPGIIGGQRLKKSSRLSKSMVFLFQSKEDNKEDGNACTGTIIAPNVIITAAHCVDMGQKETRADRTRIYFSADPFCAHTQGDSLGVRKAVEIIIHPQYEQYQNQDTDEGMKYDVALIKFSGQMPSDRMILPVGNKFAEMTEKDPVYLAGFGVTTDYDQDDKSPPLLRYIKVKPFANPQNFRGVQNGELSPRFIFDQSEKGGACRGDSGGPALFRHKGKLKIIGVASQVYARGEKSSCKAYVLHTSLSFHNNWLKTSFDSLKTGHSNPFVDEPPKPVLEN